MSPDSGEARLQSELDMAVDVPADLCVHQAIESEAAKRPESIAVQFRGETLTYRELNERANRLARRLAALGAGPDKIIGLFMERSLDMMVGLLAVLKSGAAYLPLDPAYPPARVSFMIEDAGISVLLTQSWLVPPLPAQANVLRIDVDADAPGGSDAGNFATAVTPDNLAYVIYTSGSTGTPKGVMVCHRNVINFFAGMDARIPHDPPGVWLAVTSLSFDISVLELFWTLARGFKVVLHDEPSEKDAASTDTLSAQDGSEVEHVAQAALKPIEMSLFYFASDEAESVADKYHLLLEGAKFADRNGFAAVWTPERHFHAFGGLYPNPAVASAAIAAVTQRVKIRAGSCVIPLHSPIRVAEEWALVDNLSHGRVGISFASGWQPNDFVIAPQNFANRKEAMFHDIDIVRRLWRGEKVVFPGPTGKEVAIGTLPRPVQPELPIWITAAGNPDTFRQTGEMGANLLTHLLGQSIEDLNEKLTVYRQAWREAGHVGKGHVTLMLHSFVGDDDDAVREIVRRPMKEYLRSSVDLIRRAAWTFSAFARRAAATGKSPIELLDLKDLSAEEMDALLDHAFERYFETSGLFGTPTTCAKMIARLKAAGVDEIACLIDFGVDSQQVLAHLDHLKSLKDMTTRVSSRARFDILGEIREYGVTHLQCTPSLARIMLADQADPEAFGLLRCLLIGGEAFPTSLAEDLRRFVKGDLFNMYGPTETTIWSTTHRLEKKDASLVPLGRPISNTTLYVLDENFEPVPPGLPGELFIGGAGVARGYLNRPELTAERFVPDPFDAAGSGRLYRTGDLVRHRSDGTLEFLGRLDHQVKIRGHRIELPEIEALLVRQAGVREAVVVAREDAFGVKRLAAYVVAQPGASLDVERLRAAAQATLPDFMVPAAIILIDAMPLTPNGKIDRARLPAQALHVVATDLDYVRPQGEIEQRVAAIWEEALNRPRLSRTANFFQLGGDSLLAVAVHRKLCDALGEEIPITDIFSSRTLADLAQKFHASRRAEAAPWSPLVGLAPQGAGVPLFIVHGLTGIVLNLGPLARRIGVSRPVWGLQARGLDGVESAFTRVEDMAAYYTSHMRQVQPHGPYMIAGFCFGGLVAYEMARELSKVGETVAFLGLLNSSFHYRFLTPLGRVRFQLAKQLIHARTIRRLSGRERVAYMSSRLSARLAGAGPGAVSLPYVDHLPDGQDVPPELEAVTGAAEQAFYDYDPPVYSGAVTYFQPMSRDFRNILEFAPEWRGKAAQVETLLVPGDHLTMLDPPAVDVWGASLSERLDRISQSN